MDVVGHPNLGVQEEVAATLTNSYLFEIEGYAHSPTFAGECPAQMALNFLDDPTKAPDARCLADLKLEFVVEDGTPPR